MRRFVILGVPAFALAALAVAPAWLFGASPQAPAAAPTIPFDVEHYAARIHPDLASGSIVGEVVVTWRALADVEEVVLQKSRLTIDAVTADGAALSFEEDGGSVRISVPDTPAGEGGSFTIDYRGTPGGGMQFHPERSQLYTIFSTSHWMPVVNAPSDRATFDLTVVVPGDLKVAGNGRLADFEPLSDGRAAHTFRLENEVSTYIFGLVAGPFEEVRDRYKSVTLRYLGDGFTAAELSQIFADTPAMMEFFEERAGVSYSEPEYTQALVAQTWGQEMAGVSVMSEDYGRAMLDDPAASSLAAHELAHQWWGNMITNVDWTHFWLNEGFAVFMAAAWMEERFGRETYLSYVDLMRERYEGARASSGDKPLVFPDWNSPTPDDRTIVYQKGGYVLHLLREQLGEELFWNGIRDYTRRHFGGSVETADFQLVMEESSGRDLTAFFDEWVYLR